MAASTDSFELVWGRVLTHAGHDFRQKRGNLFTYDVVGSSVIPDRTNRLLPKSHFEHAWERTPVNGSGDLQDLQGPSYIWAILTDERVARRVDA